MKIYFAEFAGTFWLVLGGCGSAILSAAFPEVGIGLLGVSLAFGLSVITMAYAVGPISGAHFNPAVTVGLWASGRIEGKIVGPYIMAQLIGAGLAGLVLYILVTGAGQSPGDFAANGYGIHSPGKYSLPAAMMMEAIMTFMFVWIILHVTDEKANSAFAPLVIGLTLTLIHLVSIPVSNTSVNPARSFSQALFADPWALQQLWVFILIPISAAGCAGLLWKGTR